MRFFLGEIPLIGLYVIAVTFNRTSTGIFKLYPLQLATLAMIIFTAVYFFRGIKLSFSEIKDIGRFSARDKAVINKGKTLILTLKKRGRMDVTLFGNNGQPPLYSESGEDTQPIDIDLFNGHTLGRKRTVMRILKYFGVTVEQLPLFFEGEHSASYEFVDVSSSIRGEYREVRITFTQTV